MHLNWRYCRFLLIFVGLLAAMPALTGHSAPTADELRNSGIEPSRKGIEEFFQSLSITADRETKIRELLLDLGSDKFRVREKATSELFTLSPIPLPVLKQAADRDPETRARVKQILAKPQYEDSKKKLVAVMQFIEAERIKGLARPILELMPQIEDRYLVQVAAEAVAISAERSDGKVLRDVIAQSRSDEARAAAVTALALVFERDAAGELERLLKDNSSRVRLEAAIALLNQGSRAALAVMVGLLEADVSEVRHTAASLLRTATGHDIAYASYDEPQKRAAAATAWHNWIAKAGANAKLQLPVRKRAALRGRILVGLWAEKSLREVDLVSGNTVFEKGGFNYVWGCHATPDGHRLAVDFDRRLVVEYDHQGKECWRQTVPGNPTAVERLPNGRTLIALSEQGLVIEIDRAGEIMWKVPLHGRPTTAQRLGNGNTLVNLQMEGKVVEVDSRGDVVWQITGLHNAHTAQQLDNGNVLICELDSNAGPGGAKEFDRAGKVVWATKDRIANPAQAQRLPNGNTLISGGEGLMEFDPQNRLVRHLHLSRSRFFAY